MMKLKIFLIVTLITATTATAFAQANRGGNGAGGPGSSIDGNLTAVLSRIAVSEIDQTEIDGLLLMREEEKLARDVYLTLADEWNIRSFENIARGEEMHMDAVAGLLERYGIDDPVKTGAVGVFTSPLMDKLYNDLVDLGMKSYSDALKVGAKIEELDIADLLGLIGSTDNDDIKVVYQNLLKGSRNHLRSFDMKIRQAGGSYSPEYLTAGEYKRIASSPREVANIISDPEYVF